MYTPTQSQELHICMQKSSKIVHVTHFIEYANGTKIKSSMYLVCQKHAYIWDNLAIYPYIMYYVPKYHICPYTKNGQEIQIIS